jgi:hypothetical protein
MHMQPTQSCNMRFWQAPRSLGAYSFGPWSATTKAALHWLIDWAYKDTDHESEVLELSARPGRLCTAMKAPSNDFGLANGIARTQAPASLIFLLLVFHMS